MKILVDILEGKEDIAIKPSTRKGMEWGLPLYTVDHWIGGFVFFCVFLLSSGRSSASSVADGEFFATLPLAKALKGFCL